MANFEIKWNAPEFEYFEKGVSWYWLTIIASAIIIAFSVWIKNFLFGFFIVIAEVLFIVWGNRVPRTVSFTLNDSELDADKTKGYLIKNFESWSAESANDDFTYIYFYFRSRVRAPLRVLVPQERIEEIRINLKTVLKEIEHQQTLLDSIEKFLRF